MSTTTRTQRLNTHREMIAKTQRANTALLNGYRNGTITLDDLNHMVATGQITVARRNLTVGMA